jgi:malate dehydrogenase (oxaloacetate-decarboxylating)
MLGRLTTRIGEVGGDIGAIDIVRAERSVLVRDITVRVQDEEHGATLVAAINDLAGIHVLQVSDRVFLAHLGGKLSMQSRVPLKTRDDLSIAYTPGVARVCKAIADEPEKVFALTWKANSVAVVSDGSAVLGLGNLGPEAALPVMEGKAILFKELANIDAVPICLRSQDPEIIVQTVEQLAPNFGGINLEDIAAPNCFLIEGRLHESLDIPVMHDDQHGTAIIRGLLEAGIGEITAVDRHGILCEGNEAVQTPMQRIVASQTNRERRRGHLREALEGADVLIGVSKGNLLTAEMVRGMGPDAIVFALANPVPEGDPEMLRQYARVVATGRSDQPNQINNVLSFPGIFRGALDVHARHMTTAMRLAAAEALAGVIPPEEISEEYIIPSVFNRHVVPVIAHAVARAAIEDGVARRDHLPAGGD